MNRRPEQPGQRRGVPGGGPLFQLGVARRPQPDGQAIVATGNLHLADDLSVAAIKPLGQPDKRAEELHGSPERSTQRAVTLVSALRRGQSMIARHQADDRDLVGVESAQFPVANQVIGMFVVRVVADVRADVVQQRAVFEPLALLGAEAVLLPRRVEERQSQLGHLL